MNESILVTGGAGFIGSNLVRALLEKTKLQVVVLDKLSYAGSLSNLGPCLRDPRFTFVQGDIGDRAAVQSVFVKHAPVQVVHLAAETHVDRSIDGPRPFYETNVMGTLELLEAAREYNASLKGPNRERFRFVHISTDEVYGSLGPTGSFSEKSPMAPNSPYAASKAAGEQLARAYWKTYELPVIIVNPSNNFGPFQFPEKLIPLMILNAIAGKPLPIYGDGNQVRDWIFVEDHCSAILTVIEKGVVGEKYNVSAGSELRNVELVDRICDILQKEVPPATNRALVVKGIDKYSDLKKFVKDRPGHDRRYALISFKISNELGWRRSHDFERGLARTIRWYLDNPEWCREIAAKGYQGERLGLALEKGAR
jgi:dTDP-glucose 4,6-dehydratase